MSSKQRTRRTQPYVQKINPGNNNKRIRKGPPNLCPDCKETSDCVKLISNKIEEIVNNFIMFDKNLQKRNANQFSIFNVKFMLNNVPCELEYDLSKFSLENLQKLGNATTQIYNSKNNYKLNINPGNNDKRIRKRSPNLCPDCKETSDCVKLVSNKINRIEEIVNSFEKNLQKRNVNQFSTFNAKFTLNNVACELEYDLSKFTLENLQKLGRIVTTQIYNNKKQIQQK